MANTTSQIASLAALHLADGQRIVEITEDVSFVKTVGFFANRREVTVVIPAGKYAVADQYISALASDTFYHAPMGTL